MPAHTPPPPPPGPSDAEFRWLTPWISVAEMAAWLRASSCKADDGVDTASLDPERGVDR